MPKPTRPQETNNSNASVLDAIANNQISSDAAIELLKQGKKPESPQDVGPNQAPKAAAGPTTRSGLRRQSAEEYKAAYIVGQLISEYVIALDLQDDDLTSGNVMMALKIVTRCLEQIKQDWPDLPTKA